MTTWLTQWTPEDQMFWDAGGKRMAWSTLLVTTVGLVLSFATWFMMSAIATRLPSIGFPFIDSQLFWLAAIPGLSGGTLRMVHTFLIPIYGTRHVITFSTIIKLIPVIGLGLAVMNLNTPFWVFMVLAFMAGFGGGDFSSYMPSTNMFFPCRLKGTALGLQAGIGNFGVSIAQFMTPVMLGVATCGAPQVMKRMDKLTGAMTETPVYVQSAVFWYVPLLIIVAIWSWFTLRSIPINTSFRKQLDIFGDKHTWYCTLIYCLTFGTFSGLSATFPLLIKTLYGEFDSNLDPLEYAFYGPLLGSITRVIFGFVADRSGGAILTTISGMGMLACILFLLAAGLFNPTDMAQFPMFVRGMMFIFLFAGIGSAAAFKQFPMIFKDHPRKAAGVIGWAAAVAGYGPFVFSIAISAFMGTTSHPEGFFWCLAVATVAITAVNWYVYQRKGAERPS